MRRVECHNCGWEYYDGEVHKCEKQIRKETVNGKEEPKPEIMKAEKND